MALFFSVILCRAQSIAEVPEATVKRFYGTVEIVSKTGATHKAYANAVLAPGESLRTGKDGTAELEIAGVGGVRVDSDSEVKVPEKIAKAPAQESLQMLKGKLFFNVDTEALKKQGGKEFRLKTPATILAVKGTRFFVAISATGETVGVHQGEVAETESVSKRTQAIRAGMAVDVAGNKLSAPRRLMPIEMASAAMYGGGELFATMLPIADGEKWLFIGCAITPDGRRFYLNRKRNIVIVDEFFQEKIWAKGEKEFWRNLAVDSQGNVYASKYDGGKRTGEIFQILGDGTQRKVFAMQFGEFLRYTDRTGEVKIGDWGGAFAFGRNSEGIIDAGILYLAYGARVWRIARENGEWKKLQQMTVAINESLIVGAFAMSGPNEAFVFNPNRLNNCAFRFTDWKILEQLSPTFPYEEPIAFAAPSPYEKKLKNASPLKTQNSYLNLNIISIYSTVPTGQSVNTPPR